MATSKRRDVMAVLIAGVMLASSPASGQERPAKGQPEPPPPPQESRPSPPGAEPAQAPPNVRVRVWAGARRAADATVSWQRIGIGTGGSDRTKGGELELSLDPGTYRFAVRGADLNGVGGNTGSEVVITPGSLTIDFDVLYSPPRANDSPPPEREPTEAAGRPDSNVMFTIIVWVLAGLLLALIGWGGWMLWSLLVDEPTSGRKATTLAAHRAISTPPVPHRVIEKPRTGLPGADPPWQTNKDIEITNHVRLAERVDELQRRVEDLESDLLAAGYQGRTRHGAGFAATPAPAATRLYAEMPDGDGRFPFENVRSERDQYCLYELTVNRDGRATVTLRDDPEIHRKALENHTRLLLPVADYASGVPTHSHTRVQVMTTGTAQKDEAGWRVVNKLVVGFR